MVSSGDLPIVLNKGGDIVIAEVSLAVGDTTGYFGLAARERFEDWRIVGRSSRCPERRNQGVKSR